MPLKLIAPGKRKGNRFYLVRGRFEGIDVEVSAQTTDESVAKRLKNSIERRILDGGVPGPEATVSLHRAIDLYAATLSSEREKERLRKIKAVMPDKPVRSVVQADIDAAAAKLHPGDSNETRARNVHTPLGSALHYAAANKWCDWLRVARPKQKEPETRAATDHALTTLYAATEGKQRLFIAWVFKHGTRVSNALKVECSRIDLRAKTYDLYITKNRTWKTFIVDDEVWELLANDPDVQRGDGLLFPWKSRWRVYDWLAPLRERLKVHFTPHMARHWLGKSLNAQGAGLRTIMGALGQKNAKSALRYVAEDVETVRSATRALGRKLGNAKASGRKR